MVMRPNGMIFTITFMFLFPAVFSRIALGHTSSLPEGGVVVAQLATRPPPRPPISDDLDSAVGGGTQSVYLSDNCANSLSGAANYKPHNDADVSVRSFGAVGDGELTTAERFRAPSTPAGQSTGWCIYRSERQSPAAAIH